MVDGSVTAIIVAAGSSRRMDGQDKLRERIAGRPLIEHTLAAFEACADIAEIVVVLSEANAGALAPLLHGFAKVSHTCLGGARRQDSVRNGLFSIAASDWVVVHDGARPLVTPELISRGLAAARVTGAATAAIPVVDTLKAAHADGLIIRTVPREGLWAVQTPQVFRHSLLLGAHERVPEDVTDDCAMVERLGHPVRLYEGSRFNLKVTTLEDLVLADALLRQRARSDEAEPAPIPAPPTKRANASHVRATAQAAKSTAPPPPISRPPLRRVH